MRPETLKFLKENIGSNFFDISLSNICLDMSPQASETKAKINYWDKIKIKNSCIHKTKRQPTEWKKIFANDKSNKGSISKIYKELTQAKTEKKVIQLKCAKDPNDISPKKTSRWPTDT